LDIEDPPRRPKIIKKSVGPGAPEACTKKNRGWAAPGHLEHEENWGASGARQGGAAQGGPIKRSATKIPKNC